MPRRSEARAATRLAAAAALMLLLGSCHFPTNVSGTLVLNPGDSGDVRRARIELHDSTGWRGAPLYTVAPESLRDFSVTRFKSPEILPGTYYLLAWQDLDGDGKLSDGDPAGVYGGDYGPRSPGKPLVVFHNWTVDAGEITLSQYRCLECTVTGEREQPDTVTDFSYAFNHDFQLWALDVLFPDGTQLPDMSAPGMKLADTVYRSGGWQRGGAVMPPGRHALRFQGVFRNAWLDTVVTVRVR